MPGAHFICSPAGFSHWVMVAAESFDEIGKSEVTSASNESSALETIDILGNGLVEKKVCNFLLSMFDYFRIFTDTHCQVI